MCDCGGGSNCQSQETELRKLRVTVKTLRRTTEDSELKKKYREQAIAIDIILDQIKHSEECVSGSTVKQIRNYIKGEQAKSNKRR